MMMLILACIAFVGTHFLLSHPLRAPLVARLGANGFLGVYSIVAFATLGWMAHVYQRLPAQAPLWPVGNGLWAAGTAVMWVGAVLFAGSLVRNPALPDPKGPPATVPTPKGVFAITRHPMMWGFGLWALVHAAVFPIPANLVLTAAIAVLALVGAALQDEKKATLQPGFWPEWSRTTSYWPFAALIAGRVPWRSALPGAHALGAGTVIWAAATWAHIPLAGVAAGIWRWIA